MSTKPGSDPESDPMDPEELDALCHLVQLGLADQKQIERLNASLRKDAASRQRAARLLMDEALLHVELQVMSASDLYRAEPSHSQQDESAEAGSGKRLASAPGKPARVRTLPKIRWTTLGQLAACFLLGAATALLATMQSEQRPAVTSSAPEATPPEVTKVAHVTSTSGALWSEIEGGQVSPGSIISAGDTVRLSSGIGVLELKSGVTLFLEGPAEVQVGVHGALNLRHGRICVLVPDYADGQQVFTSLATLQFSVPSLICVASSGDGLEVNAFEGGATAFPDPIYSAADTFSVAQGEAVRWDVSHEGKLRSWPGKLGEAKFAALRHVAKEQPVISDEYKQAVVSAKPTLYWGFDQLKGNAVLDEVTGQYTGIISGHAKAVSQDYWQKSAQPANFVIDLGYGSDHGCIQSLPSLNSLISDVYSIELWVKPHNPQLGTLATLLTVDQASGHSAHGLILELQDEYLSASQIRFTHRNPPGPSGGTTCLSDTVYATGGWQHVVAVKDAAGLRLYLDGILTASEPDTSQSAPNLQLLVGQLYPRNPVRPLVGQLDELAVYDYPLSGEQILSHYQLATQATQKSDAESRKGEI